MPLCQVRVIAIIVLFFIFITAASAQVATGTPPFSSIGGGPFDQINLGNLNVHFSIPIVTKNGRVLPFKMALTYDSSVWYPSGGVFTPTSNWGWGLDTTAVVGQLSTVQFQIQCWNGSQLVTYNESGYYQYIDVFGTAHKVGAVGASETCNGTGPGPAIPSGSTSDGSGYTVFANGSVVSRSGTTMFPPVNNPTGAGHVTDANGNQITATGTTFYDTLSSTTPVLQVAGSPSSGSMTYTYSAPGGSASVTATFTQTAILTAFNCGSTKDPNGQTANLLTKIQLADGSAYLFTYEPTTQGATTYTGRIASVTLPTGGTISYQYTDGANNISCGDGSTVKLTRTTPDSSTAWTYVRNVAAATTTITDPLSNVTSINFKFDANSNNYFETERQINQGSSTLLKTIVTCYNGTAMASCPTTAVSTPISSVAVYTQLPSTSGKVSEAKTTFNGYGLPTEVDTFDFGVGAPGGLLQSVVTAYNTTLTNGIVDRPSSVTVYDGSGHTIGSTSYGYDQTAVTAPTWGTTPQHTSISGSRGNLTTVSRSSGATTFIQTLSYFDTGLVNAVKDVNLNLTTATYTYNSTACPNSFPTLVTMPLSLTRSVAWNCTGGVSTSVTDENTNQISSSYTDPYFWRPASVTDQANNTTSLAYTVTTSESTLNFNGSLSTADSIASVDSLGRPKLTQTKQAPGSTSFDSTENDYDALGRPARSTMSYVGSLGQANGTVPSTTTTYDAAGRLLQLSDGGGGSVTYSYNQNDVLQTIGPAPTGPPTENTKQKQLEYDALGRLTSVCEILTTALPGSGACAQSNAQTGYWTKYAYDFDGTYNRTTVTQSAQVNGTPQTRKYLYDLLGRLVSETNPENGITTYSFDSATGCSGSYPGDLVQRTDARGNSTCYTYDSLHRVTSISYSGPDSANTPSKYFVYDAATVNGVAMSNAKTRLAEAYTGTSSSKITDVGFIYSPRGELSDVYQSSLNSGGYYHVSAAFWANGALQSLSSNLGVPSQTYGLDGEGRPNTTTAASGQNPVTNTVYDLTNYKTTVTYGSTDTDTFSFDPHTGRMTQYLFSVGAKTVTGALGWNTNGSLGSLTVTDNLNSADTQSCTYSHDDISRIASVSCTNAGANVWGQTFTYDAFGNINKSIPSGFPGSSFSASYSASSNQVINTTGFQYDLDGRLTSGSGHTYSWDAEGNMLGLDSTTVTYDALGRMVEKGASGTYTQIVYGPSGKKFATMHGQTLMNAFVPLPAGATAVYNSSGLAYYRHPDHLGSSRLTSTAGKSSTGSTGTVTLGGSEQSTQTGTPGTGSVTLSGSEQNWQTQSSAATHSTGTVAINGSLQSKSVPNTPGTGSVTISGSERTTTVYVTCGPNGQQCGHSQPDAGTVSITVNGYVASYSYGPSDTSATVATHLASSLNSSSSVTASVSGSTITITARTSGASTNYTLSASSNTSSPQYFSGTSFPATPSGSTLTGGSNRTIYDSGTTSITINGQGISTSWSGSSTTGTSIATALAAAINSSSSYTTATSSGATVSLTSKGTGSGVNYSLSASYTYDTADFSSATLTTSTSGSTMTGGQDAQYTTNYDYGTTTVTVNGHATPYSWSGASTTSSTIATGIAQAINNDGSAYVNASPSGAVVTVTARTFGTNTNYSLTTSTTSQKTSFSSTASGANLTGGTGTTTYDTGTVAITVNGSQATASYGQSDTASTVASKIATAVNSSSLPASASASGATVTLSSKTQGASTNYSLSATSSTSQPGTFSQASFSMTASGGAMTGGSDNTNAMYASAAYAPFGEPYVEAGTNVPDLSFTGEDQDTLPDTSFTVSTNTYDFMFRKYNAASGRWLSPDPVGLGAVDPTTPQTWNRYAYVMNNAVNLIDPTGLDSMSIEQVCGKAPSAQCSYGYGMGISSQHWGGQGPRGSLGMLIPWTSLDLLRIEWPVGNEGGTMLCHNCGEVANYFTSPQGGFLDFLRGFGLGVRAPGQTYSQCLASTSGTYSIAGAFNLQSGAAKFALGNDVSQILFGDSSEGIGGLMISHVGAQSIKGGIGTAGTMGRRTSSVFHLNLSGTPGGTKGGIEILGKTGAEVIAEWLSGAAELKLAADTGLTGAQAIGCITH